jgi:hypothetical protein
MQRSRLGRGRVHSKCLIKHYTQRLRHLIEQRLIKQHKQHKVSRPTATAIATGDRGVGIRNGLMAIGTRLGGADEDEDDSIRAAVAAATREKKTQIWY